MAIAGQLSAKLTTTNRSLMRNQQSVLIFFTGIAIGAVVALALAVVSMDLTKIPQFWAYVVLGLLFIVVAINIFLMFRGHKLFGINSVEDRGLYSIVNSIADDMETQNHAEIVRKNAVSVFGFFALYRVRMFSVFLMLGLLGELVLVVQVAALIEQTDAIKNQTERFSQKTIRDLFWQLHNDSEGSNKERAFRELLVVGGIEFNRFDFQGVDLSGMTIPRVRFNGSNFKNSKFIGTVMPGASIENTNLRDSDFSRSTLEGGFTGSNFASSLFHGALLRGNFSNTDFSGADLSDANLEGAHFGGANMTATIVTAEQLAGTIGLHSVVGLPDELMFEVKKLNPELLKHWNP